MMMITTMMKISLVVLAGMISGSSAAGGRGWFNCADFTNEHDCTSTDMCIWQWTLTGMKCYPSFRQDHTASSFVNLEAGVGVDHGQDGCPCLFAQIS